ncbi:MAG TPA: MBL fold metallo-hydrolase, partial [Candidatus Paceibacterota bacterium]|nr:MBL fold metallo-hydrolase [Candidatus Paceibacterota bacterium]
YFGGQFIRLSVGDTVVAFNPFSKKSKEKNIRFGSNIALISVDHPDYNGVENLEHGDKKPFVVRGPGEYEIGGIEVMGFAAAKTYGKDELRNTIYTLTLDGIRVCVLGALPTPELSSDTIEGIGDVDILFVPIAGDDLLSPADAEKLSVMLDAKLVIPIATSGKGDKNLTTFLKEAGAERVDFVEKLTLKRKDLEGFAGEVAVLLPSDHA